MCHILRRLLGDPEAFPNQVGCIILTGSTVSPCPTGPGFAQRESWLLQLLPSSFHSNSRSADPRHRAWPSGHNPSRQRKVNTTPQIPPRWSHGCPVNTSTNSLEYPPRSSEATPASESAFHCGADTHVHSRLLESRVGFDSRPAVTWDEITDP